MFIKYFYISYFLEKNNNNININNNNNLENIEKVIIPETQTEIEVWFVNQTLNVDSNESKNHKDSHFEDSRPRSSNQKFINDLNTSPVSIYQRAKNQNKKRRIVST